MDVIKEARNLGKAIQSDPRFLRYAKARLANDDNSELQDAIGNFNLVRMELDREANSETKSDDKIKELNEKPAMFTAAAPEAAQAAAAAIKRFKFKKSE